MNGWLQNLMLYTDTGKAGKCPFCNSDNVVVEEHNFGRKSISFLCDNCKKGDHFDGIAEKE